MTEIKKYIIYTNDKLPNLGFTINKADGSGAFDLTGVNMTSGITCVLRLLGSATPTSTGYCNIEVEEDGTCSFSLSSALSEVGIYTGQLIVTLAGGNQRTSKFQLDVQEGLSIT